MSDAARRADRGPFRADQLVSGDPYELSNGHAIRCMPTGGSGAGPNGLGFSVLAWDPAVTEAGVDAGYSPEEGTLRAPDVAVGNVPGTRGWIPGAPSLAIEYADVGQDAAGLAAKVRDLLDAGTQFVWVVHLVGPRRVEVFEKGQSPRVVAPGSQLTAPGILKNPVLVEALYDRDAAERATLANLLQRRGFESLGAVRDEGRVEGRVEGRAEGRVEGRVEGRAEGRVEGRAEGLRVAVLDLCEAYGIELTAERARAIDAMSADELSSLRARLKAERRF